MNLFISESAKGRHVPSMDIFNATLISFTIIPIIRDYHQRITDPTIDAYIKVSKPSSFSIAGAENSEFILSVEYNLEILKLLKDYYLKGEDRNIFLGYDADMQGQFMAAMMYYHLIEIGVDENDIYNVPLTEVGYNYVIAGFSYEWYSKDALSWMLESIRKQYLMMNVGNNRTRLGYRNMAALEHFLEKSNKRDVFVERLSEGVSYATYITKFTLDER